MTKITVRTNGPYRIEAEGLELLDTDGNKIPLPQGARVALCRCGHSDNKPFCDGAHRAVGFQHDPTA